MSYYHQMFGACIVYPGKKQVTPLCPELIINRDKSSKNDCKRNACKRFLKNFRREHPHLEDDLASTAPNIRMIEHYKLRYILGAKPGDHQFLFDQLENEHVYHEITDMEGEHQFRFLNQSSLNESNQEVRVNVLEYRHTDPKGKEVNFSKCTSLG